MNGLKRVLTIGLPWVLLAGCGGGSDGSSSSAPVVAPPADITSQNAPVIAGAVMQSALGGGGLGSFAGLGTGAGSVIDVIRTETCWDDSHRVTCRIDDNGNRTDRTFDALDRLVDARHRATLAAPEDGGVVAGGARQDARPFPVREPTVQRVFTPHGVSSPRPRDQHARAHGVALDPAERVRNRRIIR